MELSKKALCIVGGNGYVGRNVAKHALNLGMKVYAISRTGKKPTSNFQEYLNKI